MVSNDTGSKQLILVLYAPADCADDLSNFYKNEDTFETKFTRHVSVVQRPSSVETRINLKLHSNL